MKRKLVLEIVNQHIDVAIEANNITQATVDALLAVRDELEYEAKT